MDDLKTLMMMMMMMMMVMMMMLTHIFQQFSALSLRAMRMASMWPLKSS
jgi:hypothetical protein